MKISPIHNSSVHTHLFYCPGCETSHGFYNKIHTYNGDGKNPTVRASLLVRGYSEFYKTDFICHSFITDGKIQFLNDCTHKLAGQTVELPEL